MVSFKLYIDLIPCLIRIFLYFSFFSDNFFFLVLFSFYCKFNYFRFIHTYWYFNLIVFIFCYFLFFALHWTCILYFLYLFEKTALYTKYYRKYIVFSSNNDLKYIEVNIDFYILIWNSINGIFKKFITNMIKQFFSCNC